ncbi:hypothetical protein B0H65DRAFT_466709 [Neurospora tetraspora]|uniref:Uncharacterized protein n=1 Tax=Neurospora tetraspora TaxID=94610 RepID=A0AAE0JFK4_9PEZI|nr:hypothetical protein B0H65DRAFT_466709 [Neurospora tetraspora]
MAEERNPESLCCTSGHWHAPRPVALTLVIDEAEMRLELSDGSSSSSVRYWYISQCEDNTIR